MKAKAKGMIIADNKPSDSKGLMQLIRGQKTIDPIEKASSIPVVSTLYEEGLRLRKLLETKGNHALCGLEFSEHENEGSWKHAVEEFQ